MKNNIRDQYEHWPKEVEVESCLPWRTPLPDRDGPRQIRLCVGMQGESTPAE